MSTAENLALVAIDPASGKVRLPSGNADPVVGGAFLIDLVTAQRVALDGPGKRAKVEVLDRAPIDDPVLQEAFTRIANRGRQAPRAAVTKLGKRGVKNVGAALESVGVVRRRDAKALGLLPVTRYDVLDQARRTSLVQGVRAVLLSGQPADATTGPLIGLLHAAGLLKLVVDRTELKPAKRRATVVSEGDWASEGVRQAIAAANAAVMSAIIASTVVTAGS